MPRRAEVALQGDLGGVRVHDEPRDTGTLRTAVRVDRRIEGTPELAVRVRHLLHARVVRVGPRDDLVVGRRGRVEEQPPATDTGDRHRRRVVDAVALRRVRRREGAGAGLVLLRRERVRLRTDHLVAEADRRRRGVQRRRVGQRPDDDLVGHVVAAGSGDRMSRLVGCIRAHEVLGAAVVEVEVARARRLRGPHGEARLRRAGVTRSVDHAGRVDVLHVHAGRAGGELCLRERVDLRAREAVATPRIGVRRDVEAVGVGPDVRVIAEIRTGVRASGVRAVVGDVDLVDVPGARRIGRRADGDVQMIDVCERAVRQCVQRQDDDVEPLRRGVVEAGRVGHELTTNAGCSVDRRRIAVEGVQIDRVVHVPREPADDVRRGVVGKRGAAVRRVVDVQDVVDGLEHIAVAGAHALIRRLDGELVPSARIPLLVEVQPLEAHVEVRVRLRLLAGRGGHTDRSAAGRQAPVDDVPAVGIGRALLRGPGELVACAAVPRRELTGLRAPGSGQRNKAPACACTGRRSCGRRQGTDGERKDRDEAKLPERGGELPRTSHRLGVLDREGVIREKRGVGPDHLPPGLAMQRGHLPPGLARKFGMEKSGKGKKPGMEGKKKHEEELTPDELEEQNGEELPDREVMSLITPPPAGADGIATIAPDEPPASG